MKTEERVTLQEAAEALGISEQTARRWVKAGKLKAYKPGLRYLIPESAIEELLEGAEAPKVLLPFNVLEVNSAVLQEMEPGSSSKELREAFDAEYLRQFEGWSLDDLLDMEDRLLEQYRDLLSAIPKPGKGIEDPARYRLWARVADELRAVMVARVARGVPFREELRKQGEGN